MIKQIIALVVFLVVSFSAAGIGTLATTPNIATWYAGLAKPTWNPPNWVFGPVWTFLYISMARLAAKARYLRLAWLSPANAAWRLSWVGIGSLL
jgi:tryptophan-rich sensory protein